MRKAQVVAWGVETRAQAKVRLINVAAHYLGWIRTRL